MTHSNDPAGRSGQALARRSAGHPGQAANRPGAVAKARYGRRMAAGVIAIISTLACVALTGCAAVSDIKKASHDVESNKATIDTFTQTIKSSTTKPFEATYVTTGKSPATIVYAVDPPTDLALSETPSGTGNGDGLGKQDVIVNSAGEYSCSQTSASASWTCKRAANANAAVKSKLLSIYTPSHWVAFLKGFAVAAGLAGDKVSTSTLTVNGFSMNCVDLKTPGVKGVSKICTTSQGILGYVDVAADSAGFKITSYRPTPSPSVFQLPPGAKITNTSSNKS